MQIWTEIIAEDAIESKIRDYCSNSYYDEEKTFVMNITELSTKKSAVIKMGITQVYSHNYSGEIADISRNKFIVTFCKYKQDEAKLIQSLSNSFLNIEQYLKRIDARVAKISTPSNGDSSSKKA